MANDTSRADDDARKDAEDVHHKLDKLADSMTKLADAMGAMSHRMDSVEKRMYDDKEDDRKDRKDAKRDDEEKREDRKDRKDAKRDDEDKEDDRKDEDEKEEDRKDRKDAKRDDGCRDDGDEEKLNKEVEKEGEAKEVVADRKRKDDAKRDDSALISQLKAEIDRLKPMVLPRADADRAALSSAQARADAVYLMFGEQAPPAMSGETVPDYRRRLAKGLQKYSNSWKGVDLGSVAFADDAIFAPVETQVYNDAASAAKSAVDVAPGTLRMMERRADGHIIREYVGEPKAWMSQFAGVRQRASSDWKINLGGKH